MVLSRLKVMVLLLLASAPVSITGRVTDTPPISDSKAGKRVFFTLSHEKRPVARVLAKKKARIDFFIVCFGYWNENTVGNEQMQPAAQCDAGVGIV